MSHVRRCGKKLTLLRVLERRRKHTGKLFPPIQALIRDHLVHQSLYPGKQPLVAHCLQNVLLRLEMVINGSFGQISKRIDDVLDGGVFISLFQKQLQRHI